MKLVLRKKFLEEFYKDRVDPINMRLFIYTEDCRDYKLYIASDIEFCGSYDFNNTKKVYSILKPLIYYLYSTTYKRKFIREKFLIVGKISILNCFNFRGSENTNISVSTILDFEQPEDNEPDKNFLKKYDDEELNRNHAIENESGLYMFNLKIHLTTFYYFRDKGDGIIALTELDENGELDNELIVDTLYRGMLNKESVDENGIYENIIYENSNDEKTINSSQTFKSDECVICLTNPPHVLFCNCGHLCICGECNEL